jgi:hypothetical protein
MYPLTIQLIVVAVSTIGVLGHPGAAGAAPAMRFWEEALPGTPVPEVIADLVQKGLLNCGKKLLAIFKLTLAWF